jgi:hypothetical protein
MDLLHAIRALYASEINCGIQTHWDAGATAWIGDPANGRLSERHFDGYEFPDIPRWLDEEARRLFPQSDYARQPSS